MKTYELVVPCHFGLEAVHILWLEVVFNIHTKL